jgi:hypothetical protein
MLQGLEDLNLSSYRVAAVFRNNLGLVSNFLRLSRVLKWLYSRLDGSGDEQGGLSYNRRRPLKKWLAKDLKRWLQVGLPMMV